MGASPVKSENAPQTPVPATTIRTRLTLWYAAIFSASLLVIGAVTYLELVVEPRAKIAHQREAVVDEDAGTDLDLAAADR